MEHQRLGSDAVGAKGESMSVSPVPVSNSIADQQAAVPALARAVIAAVIDKSGSMQGLQADVVGGFNRFLADQQGLPGDAIMSVVLFDTDVTHLEDNTPIGDVKPLTEETYRPGGMTALYDAVGSAIKVLEEATRPNDRIIVVVTTDGEENSSRSFTQAQIKTMIEAKRELGWEFVYLGAGDAAWVQEQAQSMSFARSGSYANTGPGVRAAAAMVSANVGKYRTTGESPAAMQWDAPARDEDAETTT
jgi:uncharacterized protein YegL